MRHRRMNPGQIAIRLLLAAVAGTVLLVYVPPTPLAVLACGVLGALTLLLPARDSALLVITAVLLTLLLEWAARLLEGGALSAHYRPHEVLAEGVRYRPSQELVMEVPHGDLPAIDPSLPVSLAEPRTEVFRTDAHGYRNDADYSGQKLLVVGDSFVGGIGTSQESTLTAQLRRDHGIDGYNLGFAAGPVGYAERVKWARGEFSEATCLALVFFEGNDFQIMQASDVVLRDRVPAGVQDMVAAYVSMVRKPFHLSRVVYGLWTRSVAMFRSNSDQATADQQAFVLSVGGRPMGFLRGYAEVVQRTSFEDHGFIRTHLEEMRPDLIMFVPEKYRIYGPLADDVRVGPFPQAQWEHLARIASELGIPAVDTTDALKSAAEAALQSGEDLYWRDDTHWAPAGIAIGAQSLTTGLREHPRAGCRMLAGSD